jgi:SnoaL-like domain
MSAHRSIAAALSFLAISFAVEAGPTELERIAEQAVAARQKAMQEKATAADVDAFLAFATEGLVYEDPVVNVRMEGRGSIRDAMVHFLGAGRNASVVVTKRIAAANVVVLEQTVSLESKGPHGGWTPQSRHQVTLFEFEGTKIRRLADYRAR